MKKDYNFDEIIDRRGTSCIKYDWPGITEEYIPMWVADMDFRTPDFILDALRKRIDHGIMGYQLVTESYFELLRDWVKNLHGWETQASWMKFIPGIVRGIGIALCCLCKEGDKVIIQPPVYYPFKQVPERNGLEVVNNPLIEVNDSEGFLTGYRIDFDGLEKLAADPKAKVLLLCNPHNPCGISWSKEDLSRVASICHRNGVIVISDEIHCEMVHAEGMKHHPFASVSKEAAECSITFMSPSKTFNMAGIISSYVIIPEEGLREKLFKYIEANEHDFASIFSIVATTAAYTCGASWRTKMLSYIKENIEFVDSFLRREIPQIRCVRPEASFLIWLDCRKLRLSQTDLVSLFQDKAHIILNDGTMFGNEAEGFMRLNVGCPRATLNEALNRLKTALA